MIKLIWLPHWQAYSINRNNRIIGLVRFQCRVPFRQVIEFV